MKTRTVSPKYEKTNVTVSTYCIYCICSHQVRDYHKEFYRPENLCLIITGQVEPEQVFAALKPFEEKILSKVSNTFIICIIFLLF